MKAQWNSPDYDYKADDEFNSVVVEVIIQKESTHKMMDWRGKYFQYIERWAQRIINERNEYLDELRLGI